jgi:anti-sigma B factor antagonist
MFDTKTLDTGEILLSGRLDASQTDKANAVLSQITTSKTLNFKDLEYISSAGLGTLLANQQRLKALGHGLKLVNLNKHIRDIFMFTGFDKIFIIE